MPKPSAAAIRSWRAGHMTPTRSKSTMRRCKAGILVGPHVREIIDRIYAIGIPVVRTSGFPDPLEPIDIVTGPDHEAGAAVAKFLVELGHREIAYVHGAPAISRPHRAALRRARGARGLPPGAPARHALRTRGHLHSGTPGASRRWHPPDRLLLRARRTRRHGGLGASPRSGCVSPRTSPSSASATFRARRRSRRSSLQSPCRARRWGPLRASSRRQAQRAYPTRPAPPHHCCRPSGAPRLERTRRESRPLV